MEYVIACAAVECIVARSTQKCVIGFIAADGGITRIAENNIVASCSSK